jgi:hypothetical protein
VPFVQTTPDTVHAPLQHGCPWPPHAVHAPFEQANPLPHELPAQHGWVDPPHVAQVPLAHAVVVALHTFPAQHA